MVLFLSKEYLGKNIPVPDPVFFFSDVSYRYRYATYPSQEALRGEYRLVLAS
jgi:hypothetical protein